jgi:acetamidase/formamidase
VAEAVTEHVLNPEKTHHRWNRDLPPALEIRTGDVVVFDTAEVSGGQIHPGVDLTAVLPLNPDRVYPLGGPVFIDNARPGDVLEVEILTMKPGAWGWTAILPNAGLLPEDYPTPHVRFWDLSNGQDTMLRPDIVIPLDPFCGVMGVAPEDHGEFRVLPPGPFGGNMDIRHLTTGATLFLPVQVDGALFSAGDCHAAQGDGEVCVSGIECPMAFSLRFNVRKGHSIRTPRFMTRGPLTAKYDTAGYYATTGVAPDLMDAAKTALREMIGYLVEVHQLSREDAYILASVAVDLKISEVVDRPNWIVSAYVPRSIFR